MEKEKLIIKNFGPIKNVELELGRFNVLIGEQATGKTMIGKILCCCRYFSYIIQNDHDHQPFERGLESWGLAESIRDNTFIYYECFHYSLKIERKEAEFINRDQDDGNEFEERVPIFFSELNAKSKEFDNLLAELEKIKPNTSNPFDTFDWIIPTSFFLNDVAPVMNNPLFIPTERGLQSIFSLGKNSISNIDDSLFNQFAKVDQIQRHFKTETIIEPFGIEYKNENGYGSFRKPGDSVWYKMGSAPSGYQTTIPIVLALKYYGEDKKGKSLVIDEPEISLFPSAQNNLVKFIANEFNTYNGFFFITTHSPYILTSLNNLIYAYQIGQKDKDKVNEIIEERYWINPTDISAYLLKYDLEANGVIQEDLLDKEGLIKAEKIDSVSAILNSDFNAIMDIELNIQK